MKATAAAIVGTLFLTVPTISHAQRLSVELAVEDVPDIQNCGIEKREISGLLVDLADEKDIRIRRSGADLFLFADVNVLPIPNSLGVWSGTCSFNINIEFQRHHELALRGVGDVLVGSKLCDAGFMGYISDGNLGFFRTSIRQSFANCFAQLPRRLVEAITS